MLNKKYMTVLGVAVGATTLAGIAQTMPLARAAESAHSSTASVTVTASCSMTGTVNTPHTDNINNGQTKTGIGQTTLKAICNDASGFAIYAVGYGQDTIGNTVLHSDSVGTTYDIATGTEGNNSYWAMRVSPVSGDYAPTIQNNFDSAHVVPNKYMKVAQYGSTTDATTGSSVTTTYDAHISATQPAGTYTGKVKYVLIHPSGTTPSDNLTMQSVDVWGQTMLTGETYKAVDTRDNKEYYVSKLDDGNIWMTQNLDLCIGCTGTTTLTSDNTDLHVAGTGIYTDGYSTDGNGLITWTPSGSTMTGTPATITNYASGSPANSVEGWTNSTTAPYMAEGGDHWLANNTLYSDRSTCVDAASAELCDHKYVGNYYNYTASIASNNSTGISDRYATADNSICPKGWRLPDGPDGTNGSDYNTLLSDANIITTSTDESQATVDPGTGTRLEFNYATGGLAKMEGLPYAFGRFGYVNDTTFYYLAGYGYYWSGSTVSSSGAFYLYYYGSYAYPADQGNRAYGWSVRCVAR